MRRCYKTFYDLIQKLWLTPKVMTLSMTNQGKGVSVKQEWVLKSTT